MKNNDRDVSNSRMRLFNQSSSSSDNTIVNDPINQPVVNASPSSTCISHRYPTRNRKRPNW